MIIKLFTLCFTFCFVSCYNTNIGNKTNHINTLTLDKNYYIYELNKPTNKKYPYKLWPFRIGGEYDGIHKEVAIAPKGSIVMIHSKKLKRDLYIPEYFMINGIIQVQGREYRIETTITK
jgi:hypothetical protein